MTEQNNFFSFSSIWRQNKIIFSCEIEKWMFLIIRNGLGEGVRVSQATIIMISSLLEDSSDVLNAISVQMITKITYKINNSITIK